MVAETTIDAQPLACRPGRYWYKSFSLSTAVYCHQRMHTRWRVILALISTEWALGG